MPLAMDRRRTRRSCPGAAVLGRGVLALALVHGPAHAAASPAPTSSGRDPGVLAAEGQARRDAGDLAGAIDRWQQALAALPVTQATAHRRAGLVLAIAGAHEAQYERGREAKELQRALWVLDEHLAGLDPTDDENRVAVERRRAAVAATLDKARAPVATSAPVEQDTQPRAPDRRLWVAGGTVVGLGVVGVAVLGFGLGLGARADAALQGAVDRPGDDPEREAAKAAALDRGQRANDAALAGGVIGGVLLVTGVALLIAGISRGRGQPRAARVAVHGASLRLRF